MSIHLIERAALMPMPAAKKLVLMAFADAADRDTRVAMPGLENVQRWAGVGKSRTLELVAELADEGLLVKVAAGRRGRRAEYAVLPGGCCGEHGPLAGHEQKGSATPDPNDTKGSDHPDPKPVDNPANGSTTADPKPELGSGKGPIAAGPLPSFPKEPPQPPAAAGGANNLGCPRHGTRSAPGCRGCGTTPRQAAERERRQVVEAERAAARSDAEARRRARETATPARAPVVADALATARASIRAARRTP